ncbi:MAG: thioredoxin domain-containing protein [Sphingomonadales bacterium]|nr:thioredoxin domain-containing protein [Sphingomonadales bacterium]MBD3774553.1 thioredoxin domain-containing protein [Paracoccaceae bacterium]
MKFSAFARFAAVGAAALMLSAASSNWNATVTQVANGHIVGNPDAPHTLVEWVSYTCPHCGHFARDGDGALAIAYVGPGKLKHEIRPIIRNGVDLAATMLVNCGAPAKFPQNHAAFFYAQEKFLPIMASASKGQTDRWGDYTHAAGRRAIAADLGFYDIMERRGYSRVEADRCMADDAAAKAILDTSEAEYNGNYLTGTPSFAIDGIVLAGTFDWAMLQPQLDARY